ncbi:hypothetical protein [Spirobacillus cienkowskii]|uniref:hypothetical protein n=1 Tax=Spirobacillus cienkowskii TaxID=495820 RepID=UPI0030D4E112
MRFNIPDHLYKYRPLNSKICLDRLKDIILNKKLYFPEFTEFNDPFEFEHNLTFNSQNKFDKIKFIDNAINCNPLFGFLVNCKNNKDKINGFENYIKQHDLLKSFTQVYHHEAKKIGVCCFSGTNDNINLWSNYSYCHKGICLKYKVGNKNKIIKVEYTSNPEVSFYDIPTIHDYYREMSRFKYNKFWDHEDEYRILNNKGNHDLNDLGLQLDSIFLGINFYNNPIAKDFTIVLKNILKNNNIKIFKANKDRFNQYGIKFNELDIRNIELILNTK